MSTVPSGPAARPVRSPCVSICALNDADICVGCQRSASEISRWGRMTDDERREVLVLCQLRARESGNLL
ncbi:DUF1289 domain-containing protein [Stutzerimonas azotifigens]|uniref:DUF1289 domain-containing protein n=1 Tax=Stutzerimonas azotifigens TaxID=291995 RepID=UPI000484E4A6|nr:DUF1289 domain-containing protein [Stutzerimonas azotifigens]